MSTISELPKLNTLYNEAGGRGGGKGRPVNLWLLTDDSEKGSRFDWIQLLQDFIKSRQAEWNWLSKVWDKENMFSI